MGWKRRNLIFKMPGTTSDYCDQYGTNDYCLYRGKVGCNSHLKFVVYNKDIGSNTRSFLKYLDINSYNEYG